MRAGQRPAETPQGVTGSQIREVNIMTREEINAQAAAKLATRTLAQLLNDWDMTEHRK